MPARRVKSLQMEEHGFSHREHRSKKKRKNTLNILKDGTFIKRTKLRILERKENKNKAMNY